MRPHRWQPTSLPRPWDSPGKNTGVGCHFLLQCMKVKGESEVAQSCPTLSDPLDCSRPGSFVHGIALVQQLTNLTSLKVICSCKVPLSFFFQTLPSWTPLPYTSFVTWNSHTDSYDIVPWCHWKNGRMKSTFSLCVFKIVFCRQSKQTYGYQKGKGVGRTDKLGVWD